MRKILAGVAACALTCLVFVGCGANPVSSPVGSASQPAQSAGSPSASGSEAQSRGIDYMVLVNKLNPLPDGWEDALETVHMTNSVGDDVEVEKKTYDAYLELKADLEKDGVYVDLDSARRSVADHGFILRALEGAEHLTGYGYEPWHIRYIDNVSVARDIMASGITFEEHLGAVESAPVSYDYGDSKLYAQQDLEEAAVQVKCEFATFEGCELHSLRYAGDGCDTPENLAWLNGLDQGAGYTHVAEFLTDFHSPVEGGGAWTADVEMKDYQWWLARTDDGGWQLVSFGY